jgi:hypothetical protein
MSESFSKSETELRLEIAEQRGQIRFEQLINLISSSAESQRALIAESNQIHNTKFAELTALVSLLEKDNTWIKWSMASVVLPLIAAIIAFLFNK